MHVQCYHPSTELSTAKGILQNLVLIADKNRDSKTGGRVPQVGHGATAGGVWKTRKKNEWKWHKYDLWNEKINKSLLILQCQPLFH